MLIEIKNHFSSEIIYKYENKENSIKITITKAVELKIDLRGAYLQGADLLGANLEGSYLQGANLQGANLEGSYLQGANLQGSNLQGAYLRGANLRGSDLQGAKYGEEIIIDIKMFSGFGSERRCTVFIKTEKRIIVDCGCFRNKTLEEFEEKVKITHAENNFAREYFLIIEMIKKLWEVKK